MAIYKDVEDLIARLPTTRLTDSRKWSNGYNNGWYDFRRALIEAPTEDWGTVCSNIKGRRSREINSTVQWMKDFCSCAEENGFTRDEAIQLLRNVFEYNKK